MNNNGQGSEGCLITCSMGMDSYHVLAKCVSLDNIETNSRHEQKLLATFGLHPIACKGKWMMRTIQVLQYLIKLIQQSLCVLATSQGTDRGTIW